MTKQEMHKDISEKLAEAEHALSAATGGQFAHLYDADTVARLTRKVVALKKRAA
jgi:hypothetical protein